MTSKIIKVIVNIIVIVAIGFFLYNVNFKEILNENIDFNSSFILICLTVLSTLFLSLVFKIEVSYFSVFLTFKYWFGLTTINTLYNYVLPMRGGLAVRAFFLKKKHSFSYIDYSSMLIGSTIISFLVASVVALTSASILHVLGTENRIEFIFISTFSFLFTLSLIFFSNKITWLNKIIKWQKVLNVLSGIQDGFKRYYTNPKLLVKLIIVHFIYILLMSLRLYFVFQIFNVEIDFLTVLLIRSLVIFSMIISITPGNFGISEGIIGLLAFKTGINLDIAFLIATLDRIFSIIVNVIIGLFFHFFLIRELK